MLRPVRFCSGEPETEVWCVSRELCFVSIIWSFLISRKVELEQTLGSGSEIYGKNYRRIFFQ